MNDIDQNMDKPPSFKQYFEFLNRKQRDAEGKTVTKSVKKTETKSIKKSLSKVQSQFEELEDGELNNPDVEGFRTGDLTYAEPLTFFNHAKNEHAQQFQRFRRNERNERNERNRRNASNTQRFDRRRPDETEPAEDHARPPRADFRKSYHRRGSRDGDDNNSLEDQVQKKQNRYDQDWYNGVRKGANSNAPNANAGNARNASNGYNSRNGSNANSNNAHNV